MTWKEFKEAVEKQGVTDGDDVDWIDFRPTMETVHVGWQEYPAPEFRKPDTLVTKSFSVSE